VTQNQWPWAPGTATGVGSLPGTQVDEALKYVFGELSQLPYLPELPDRGPGADMIGRGAGFLVDLPVDLYAGRWRATPRPGHDLRRTLDFLARDLDALTEIGDGYTGPLKVQAPGPWTLAASIERAIGGRLLRDHGATRDLTDSLAEGLRTHVAEVARRVPGATVLLQLDEPSLPTILAGRIPTESGLGTLRAIAAIDARDALRSVVDRCGVPVILHCCAANAPLKLFAEAGASAVSIDLSTVDDTDSTTLDAIGEVIDAGLGFFAGAVPSLPPGAAGAVGRDGEGAGSSGTSPGSGRSGGTDGSGTADPGSRPTGSGGGALPSEAQVADRVVRLWRRLGFPLERVGAQVVVTPACGLAGASPNYAKSAQSLCAAAAHRLADLS
jgi:methionine synthase II (cobalamin-independent)